MVQIKGIGFVGTGRYGALLSGNRRALEDATAGSEAGKHIFSAPFDNFGRLDAASRVTCYAVALAFSDAGIAYHQKGDMEIGIVGGNDYGCAKADGVYYSDYLKNGRKLGRSNYFIYTLPSSPIAEAAIHFVLKGPLLYVSSMELPIKDALSTAGGILESNEADLMLAGVSDEEDGLFFLLERWYALEGAEGSVLRLDDVIDFIVRTKHSATLALAIALNESIDQIIQSRAV